MKLIDKYRNLSAPLKASLWFLLCSVLQKGIALLTTPIFTRIMTEQAYGQFAVYNSWYNIFFAIATLNFAAGVFSRGLIKNEECQDEYTSSMVGLSSLCVAIAFVIYLIFHKAINDVLQLSTFLVALMFIEIWTNSVFQFWSNKERVNYRYSRLIIVTLLYVVACPILSIVFIVEAQIEWQLQARVMAMCLVCFLIFSVLFVEIVIRGKKLFDKKYWLHALKFNIPLLPHYLSQILLNQSDKLMISKMCSMEEAAYYSVVYSIAMILLIVNTSINSTMNPWIYKTIKVGEYDRIAKVSYVVLLLIAICNCFVVAVGPELLWILAPDSYQDAVYLIPPLTTSVYFIFLYSLFATFEYYYDKTSYVAIASVIGAVLNIILNYVFIHLYGYMAAGYTTLVCYFVFVMMHYLFMRKVNKECMGNIKVYDIRIILSIGCCLLIISAIMMLLYPFTILRYLLLLLIMIAILVFSKKIVKYIVKNWIGKAS